VTTLNPTIQKVIEDLPSEDPDKDRALVWAPHCSEEAEVPVGRLVEASLGVWTGPVTLMSDIIIYYQIGNGPVKTMQDVTEDAKIRAVTQGYPMGFQATFT